VDVTLEEQVASVQERPEEFLALDEALDRLAAIDARKAKIVELHYFAGFTYAEIAGALEISDVTVFRDLHLARAWLADQLGPERAAAGE
jgi:RNA polymerase sigma factor (sigma-70 family)